MRHKQDHLNPPSPSQSTPFMLHLLRSLHFNYLRLRVAFFSVQALVFLYQANDETRCTYSFRLFSPLNKTIITYNINMKLSILALLCGSAAAFAPSTSTSGSAIVSKAAMDDLQEIAAKSNPVLKVRKK